MFFWFSNQPKANLCIDHICYFVQSLVFLSSIPSVAAALRQQPGQLLVLIRGLFQVNQLEPIGHLCLWFPTEHCFLRSTVIAGNLASELSGSVRSQIVILSKIGVFTESRLKVSKVGGARHSKTLCLSFISCVRNTIRQTESEDNIGRFVHWEKRGMGERERARELYHKY